MMPPAFLGLAALLGGLVATANGHMIMANPVPYGHPDNSPLNSDGSNFPCKGNDYTIVTNNEFPAGSQQKLTFTGSAVHGGGSCQLSVTLDKEPSENSEWKVIHSIEGGCPGYDSGPREFTFTVPKELPNGQYTLAWTWFNKIGNREMYMNCAPIHVTGGASDTTFLSALPDMFIANIPQGGQCKTVEMQNPLFPNPGTSVEKDTTEPADSFQYQPGCGSPASGDQTASPSPASTVAVAPTAVPSTSASAPVSTGVPSATTSAVAPPIGTAPTTFQTVAPTSSPTGSLSSDGTACTSEGAVVCKDKTTWGICDHGKIVWRPVAPGTQCVNGEMVKRAYVWSPRGAGRIGARNVY